MRGAKGHICTTPSPRSVSRGCCALAHVRLQEESRAAFHVNTTFAEIAERGTYDAFVLTLGARLARTEIHARLAGPGGPST